MNIANKLEELIGRTPLFRLPHTDNVTLLLKLEMFNPGLSVKDRVAKHILHKGREQGEVKSGQPIVAYTSGNFGIGLAQLARLYGHPVICVVPSTTSEEKISLLRNLGAQVVVCDNAKLSNDSLGMAGMAKNLATALHDAYFIDQFSDPRNLEAHYLTTGPEIWEQTEGKIDYLFAAMGTGGTASGIGKFLKEKETTIKVYGVSPDSGVFHSRFYGLLDKRIVDSEIEGIGEDFLPANLDFRYLDGVIEVSDKETMDTLSIILEQTGFFLGGSSGASLAAARKFEYPRGKSANAVVICPDSGNRYLSTIYKPKKIMTSEVPTGELQNALSQFIKKVRGVEQYPYMVS